MKFDRISIETSVFTVFCIQATICIICFIIFVVGRIKLQRMKMKK
ncbi:uncharacterized protein CELE_F43G9.21 [Caenorhabditis elegans]|uniref:Uncharacterized protein n=1 Tax=Caenorhabditis elegans TaxID=6239 RepID=H2L2D8_CAEEL|nr:Uncharacterized protein CELE_F43G9.21 [Caenorhabditis elegans]CCE71411.1 Uncharacterized protein CELE_F43G9.21 [Caenorhabditis elegans]|eukprot:NP_001250832.1 Uncharacterized protein CELE_F43G9.21 [Caenorhabditis elegans]